MKSFIPFITLLNLLIPVFAGYAKSVETVLGTGEAGYSGDGGPAVRAKMRGPFGVVRGPDGCLYVCDTYNHCMRKIDTEGIVTKVAGVGEKKGYSGDDGLATEALLNEPYEMRFDEEGDMYFVEMMNHVIRKVDMKTGKISTVAGKVKKGFSGDGGMARKAMFNRPHSIQFGPDGDLYVCDIGNHRIRRIFMKTGKISTFSGTGKKGKNKNGGKIRKVDLNGPRAIDVVGNTMWLALREGNAVYRMELDEGTIHHVAGTGKKGFSGNGGPVKLATLSGPKGIALDPEGNIYLSDTESHTVRMIDLKTGKLEIFAGDGKKGDGPEGKDPKKCGMDRLHGILVDQDGAVYVGDTNTHRIRVFRP